MGEVREENNRLKKILSRVVEDYRSLQMHFQEVIQQEPHKKTAALTATSPTNMEEPGFVSLSLGTSTGMHKKEEKNSIAEGEGREELTTIKEGGLTLGLSDCKVGDKDSGKVQPNVLTLSPEGSSKDDTADAIETTDQWPPKKTQKNLQSGGAEVEDDIGPLPQVKKARVSVRARCDAPTVSRGGTHILKEINTRCVTSQTEYGDKMLYFCADE